MTETTARLRLPMIVPGQAQKEMTHNEALTMLDIALHADVMAMGIDTPPSAPTPGDCWIVGTAPTGAWTGQARAIAGWTAGGWRFVEPREGFVAHVFQIGARTTFHDGEWRVATAIPAPAGGDVVDLQARTAIAAILDVLRRARWIP